MSHCQDVQKSGANHVTIWQRNMEFNHVRAAYKISWKHKPCKGSFGKWQYPSTKDVLKECGLYSIEEYLQTRSTGIAMYVVDRPLYLECSEGGRRRGSMLHQQWWEQELGLDVCYVKFAAGSTQLAGRRWVCLVAWMQLDQADRQR
jgi:hypothetical protein